MRGAGGAGGGREEGILDIKQVRPSAFSRLYSAGPARRFSPKTADRSRATVIVRKGAGEGKRIILADNNRPAFIDRVSRRGLRVEG
jgi:hypothetical protein